MTRTSSHTLRRHSRAFQAGDRLIFAGDLSRRRRYHSDSVLDDSRIFVIYLRVIPFRLDSPFSSIKLI